MKVVFKTSVVNALAVVATLLSAGAPAYAELPESCRYSCSPRCMDELARLEAEITSFKNYNCYGNHPAPVPNPPPADDDRVEIYSSDSCSGNLLAIVDARTDCANIGAGNAWGVKMNGKCYNIKDTTLSKACQAFSGGMKGIKFYQSDSCNGELIGTVGRRTDCNRFADNVGNTQVWGVEINGQCQNIQDMSALNACQAFKAGDRGGVKFYQSDSCKGNLIAIVNPSSDCRSYPQNMPQVWGVEIDGQCQNIDDMPFATACARFAH